MSVSAISQPLGHYPSVDRLVLDHPRLPYYDGEMVIEEPQLLAKEVSWQPVLSPPPVAFASTDLGLLFDRRQLGGKLTILVFCRGDRVEIHRQCLDSILKTVPAAKLDLRVGAVAIGVDSLKLLGDLPISKLYLCESTTHKYDVMRQMLWDDAKPIETNYLAWFDDDARVSHTNWLNLLADEIIKQSPEVGMYGIKLYHPLRPQAGRDPRSWFKEADWFKGKFFRTRQGTPVPNGDTIHFCDDWFWVLRTQAMRDCCIPCRRITGPGGSIVVGEQLHQGGYRIKQFNAGKSLIYVSRPSTLRTAESSLPYPWQSG